MPYPVQNLIEGRGQPTAVHPDDSVSSALALMREHDYSQLPVIDQERRALGMVTPESVLRAHINFGVSVDELHVSDAMIRADAYRPEDDLFDLLNRLKDTNAVIIVDGENKLIGIVTSYDSNEYLRRRAEDMMLVEDIENSIKDLILVAFLDAEGEVLQDQLDQTIEEITSSRTVLLGRYRNALGDYLEPGGKAQIDQKRLQASFSHLAPKEKPKTLDDLTLSEYAELFLRQSRHESYQPMFKLAPEALRRLLNGVRETRNTLAHFRGEISSAQRDQLRFCADWLGRHSIGIPVSWPTAAVAAPPDRTFVRESGSTYITLGTHESEVIPTEEQLGPGDSRYAPLAIWLSSQPSSQSRIQLSFEDVEEIIGDPLPASAREHRAWWANDIIGHAQSQQWLDAGWRVASVNMTNETIRFARIKEREAAYITFFSALQTEMRVRPQFPLKAMSPDGQSWLVAATLPEGGPQSLYFNFSFAHNKRLRVELYIDSPKQKQNKDIFDSLFADRDKLEAAVGHELSWERLDDKRASRIAVYHPGAITYAEEKLAQLRIWAADTMVRFYTAISEPATQALFSTE